MLRILTLAFLSGSEGFPGSGHGFLSRVKRDDCAAIQTAHGECTSKAYADYQAEWAAGDDGRPDWVARKTKVRGVWLPMPITGGREPLARPIGSQDPGPPSWMFGTATN